MMMTWLNRIAHTIAIIWLTLVMILAFLLFSPTGLNTLRGIGNYFLEPIGISLRGDISGRLNHISLGGLNIDMDGFQLKASNIELNYQFFKLIYGNIAVNRMVMQQLHVNINDTTPQPTAPSSGDDTPFDMPLPLIAKNIQVGEFSFAMNGSQIISATDISIDSVTLKGDLLNISDTKLMLEGAYPTTLSKGTIILNDPYKAELTLTLKAQINEDTLVDLDHIELQGGLASRFTIKTQGMLTQGDNSQPIQANTTIDTKGLATTIQLETLANIQATLDFDTLAWTLKGQTDPMVAKISGDIMGQITTTDQGTQIKTSQCDLNFEAQSVNCMLDIRFLESGLNLDHLVLKNDHNNDIVDLFAKIESKQWQFKSTINIAQLHDYTPLISGKITNTTNINITENQSAPDMDIDINLDDAVILGNVINHLHIDTGATGSTQFNLSLQVPNHSMTLQSDIEQLDLGAIKVSLNQLDLDANKVLIKLKTPSTISANWATSIPTLSITPLCLEGSENNHLCISADITDTKRTAMIAGVFNPILLQPVLPIAKSTVNVTIDGAYNQLGNQPIQAHLDITAPSGAITLASLFGDNIQSSKVDWQDNILKLERLDSHLAWNSDKATLNFDIKTPINNLSINGNLDNLDPSNLSKATLNVQGNLEFEKFGWIASLFPTIPAQVQKGAIKANFKAVGALFNPQISGNMSINDAQLYILMSNTLIEDINANLALAYPQRSTLKMTANIDQSPLNINGWFEKGTDGLDADINVTGENLTVMNIPDINVVISPNITYTLSSHASRLSGKVTINKAILNIDGLQAQGVTNTIQNDVVYASDDEDNDNSHGENNTPFAIALEIILEDNITLKGYGLNANIKGNLNVNAEPNQPILGRGQIDIYKGTFAAYGKAFNIDPSSVVIFSNSPVDNPTLNITALYVIPTSVQLTQPDVPDQIGVRVTGSAQNPTVALFSNPSLSPTDILSFILFGQSISNSQNTQGADNSAMLQAALLLAINEGGSGAIDTIKDTFDVADISVGTISSGINTNSYQGQGQSNNTAVFIGKQLFTRLYVSYGVGIFTGEQQGIATFSITPQWKLRGSASNMDNTLTVLYTTHSKD